MKFCLLVTVALDIFIKEKNNTLYLGLLLCQDPPDITTPPRLLYFKQISNPSLL